MVDTTVHMFHRAGSVSSPIPGSEWNAVQTARETQDEVIIDGVRKKISGTLDDYQRDPKPGVYRMKDITSAPKLPSVYFDAVKLNAALTEIAHNAQQRVWALGDAMRNVRLEKDNAELALTKLYHDYMDHADNNLKVLMLVNELANTIDEDKEPGVSLERYYAFRPVWEFIKNIRQAFNRSDS